MRCLSCNCELSDYEATRRFEGSGEFVDLCDKCFSTIKEDVIVLEREDLKDFEDYQENED